MLKFEKPPAQIPARLLVPLALLGILLVSTGCNEAVLENAAAKSVYYDIDPFFEPFYERIGGGATIGPAITPLFVVNNISYQYTVYGLMGHNPEAPVIQRYFLGSIGLDLAAAAPAILEPAITTGKYLDGHIIFDEFIPLYDRLGGRAIVGKPLTEVFYNPENKRFEQHFENLGFYRNLSDPPGSARLLAYGIYKCADSCQAHAEPAALVSKTETIDPRFSTAVARLGPDLTGMALTKSYNTPDGYLEQVFGSIVLISDPTQPGRAVIRPITVRLAIHPDLLENPSAEADTVFYSIQGDLGYNVLSVFMDYIGYHGGIDASGPPISKPKSVDGNTTRQCFLNFCLDLHRRVNYPPLILPAPLGYTYKELELEAILPSASPQEKEAEKPDGSNVQEVVQENQIGGEGGSRIQVWEREPLLAQGASQEITILVTEDNLPVRMVEAYIIIDLPDGSQMTEYLLPTGADGQSKLQLMPLQASNGALITYTVCAFHPREQLTCTKDGFLIGQAP